MMASHSDDPGVFASMREVTVEDDVSGVEVMLKRGDRVEGRIIRDGARRLPFDPKSLRLGAELRGGLFGMHFAFAVASPVQADGSFALQNVVGPTTFRVSDLPEGWMVKSVSVDGVDVTDKPVDLGGGATHRAEIVLTDARTEINGRVTDQAGRPATNYIVVVFPADQAKWRPPSRVVQATRSRHDGSYRFDRLPPTDYLAAALVSLPWGAWTDTGLLERLQASATQFRLDDGEQQVLDLRLSPAPEGR
jgi:hypothetical protein